MASGRVRHRRWPERSAPGERRANPLDQLEGDERLGQQVILTQVEAVYEEMLTRVGRRPLAQGDAPEDKSADGTRPRCASGRDRDAQRAAPHAPGVSRESASRLGGGYIAHAGCRVHDAGGGATVGRSWESLYKRSVFPSSSVCRGVVYVGAVNRGQSLRNCTGRSLRTPHSPDPCRRGRSGSRLSSSRCGRSAGQRCRPGSRRLPSSTLPGG